MRLFSLKREVILTLINNDHDSRLHRRRFACRRNLTCYRPSLVLPLSIITSPSVESLVDKSPRAVCHWKKPLPWNPYWIPILGLSLFVPFLVQGVQSRPYFYRSLVGRERKYHPLPRCPGGVTRVASESLQQTRSRSFCFSEKPHGSLGINGSSNDLKF